METQETLQDKARFILTLGVLIIPFIAFVDLILGIKGSKMSLAEIVGLAILAITAFFFCWALGKPAIWFFGGISVLTVVSWIVSLIQGLVASLIVGIQEGLARAQFNLDQGLPWGTALGLATGLVFLALYASRKLVWFGVPVFIASILYSMGFASMDTWVVGMMAGLPFTFVWKALANKSESAAINAAYKHQNAEWYNAPMSLLDAFGIVFVVNLQALVVSFYCTTPSETVSVILAYTAGVMILNGGFMYLHRD